MRDRNNDGRPKTQAEIRAAQERAARFHEEAAERQRTKHKQGDRDRLADNFRKKLLTSGVGALATFEEFFGYLWGQGKSLTELTENERDFLALYQKVRDNVFDNVNSQIRGSQAEIALHSVEYRGNIVNLPFHHEKE